MGGEKDRGGGDPLERVLAVRNQRRAHAAAEEAAKAARSQATAEEAKALAAERLAIDEIDRRLAERARAREARGRVVGAAERPDRRPKPRLEVPASVILDCGGTALLCPLVDISLTGALFSTGGVMCEGLELGSQHAVTIVADEDAKRQLEVVGRVVRCVGDTFALDWSGHTEVQADLARLLDSLSTPRLPGEDERRRAEIDEIDDRLEALEAGPHPTRSPPHRAKTRLVLSASLLLEHGGRAEQLVLLNVSRTGGLVASAGAALSKLRVGTLVFLSLARSDDPAVTVDLLARVMRHEGHATAVDWSEDHSAEYGVARFLDQLAQEGEES